MHDGDRQCESLADYQVQIATGGSFEAHDTYACDEHLGSMAWPQEKYGAVIVTRAEDGNFSCGDWLMGVVAKSNARKEKFRKKYQEECEEQSKDVVDISKRFMGLEI